MSLTTDDRAPADAPRGQRTDRFRALVLAHQAGDEAAFEELVRGLYPELYRHALRRLGDTRAAEDAVQDSLLRAYRSLDTFDGERHVRAWLHRIVANVCADEFSRRRRESTTTERLRALPVSLAPSPDEIASRGEVVTAVADAVSSLPANYREALVLRDVMELDYRAVASRAGISEQNARARVHRARAALRRVVETSAAFGAAVVGGTRRFIGGLSTDAATLTPTVSTMSPELSAMPSRLSIALPTVTAAAVAIAAPMLSLGLSGSPRPIPVANPSAAVAAAGSGDHPGSSASRMIDRTDGGANVAPTGSATAASPPPIGSDTTAPASGSSAQGATVPGWRPLATGRSGVPGATSSDAPGTPATSAPTHTATSAPPGMLPVTLTGQFSAHLTGDPTALNGPGSFLLGSLSPASGAVRAAVSLANPSSPTCAGILSGQYTPGGAGQSQLTMMATVAWVSTDASTGARHYTFSGLAKGNDVVAAPSGRASVAGVLEMDSDGSAATMTATVHLDGAQNTVVAGCPGSPPS